MAKRKVQATRDLGLDLGLLFAKYLMETEDLHYGLWEPGVEVKLANMPAAQVAYTNFLFKHIPENTKSILDVGCGSGVTAEKLLDKGYEVECVAPPAGTTEAAAERLEGRATVNASGFEEFKTDKRFDLVLFSESFQYVRCREGLTHAISMLNPGGAVLVCDFFKRTGIEGSPIGGGHKFNHWTEGVSALNLETVTDIDITDMTAPNLDLVADFLEKVGKPGYEASMHAAKVSYPKSLKIARWFFKKKIAKMEHKYFSGLRDGAAFATHKTYRLLLVKPKEN
ncbi:MAG: methyltransferase domain-containing protein [Planctomycetota bacterium]|jgi:ubiquinone/menaquinone biosynthesis C-methylase UbiE